MKLRKLRGRKEQIFVILGTAKTFCIENNEATDVVKSYSFSLLNENDEEQYILEISPEEINEIVKSFDRRAT